MSMFNSKKQKSVVEEKNRTVAATDRAERTPERKLRSLTVRSGIKAGLANAGCNSGGCHGNHNETLITR